MTCMTLHLRLPAFLPALLPCLLVAPSPAQDKPAPPPPSAGDPAAQAKPDGGAPPADEEPRGLRVHEKGAWDGYTIIQPLNSKKVHLVDMDGEIVHTWESAYTPGAWLFLEDDGRMFRCGRKEDKTRFHGGGIGGIVQEIAWDGTVTWEYELANDERMLHHDIEPMPNGNILLVAWENHTREEAIANGRDEEFALEEGFWPDVILEVKPTRPKGGEIVWTWRSWDHLVQDRDAKKAGYGALREHPGRIDINADQRYEEKKKETDAERKKREELEKRMRATGYVGGGDSADADAKDKDKAPGAKGTDGKDAPPPGGPPKPSGDWLHTNGVDYLPGQDLLVVSAPHVCELWVIDHSTTTAQAAGSAGGRRGHGGDLLWRWGNPRNYGCGAGADKKLFYQHDPSWLPSAEPGDLRVLVFNNGAERPGGEYSSVEELALPFDAKRGFVREKDAAFGPAAAAWSYHVPEKYLSPFISGAQRLPNGDTLICCGAPGRVFEVTSDGRVVWDYLNPMGGEVELILPGPKAPPKALFRAVRVPRDHPGVKGKI